ncbi:MAG: AAA family ATPase [Candidatus Riflebacteria bacterium]|nr:AAA family ATPase [Candidatus Riflebacteria bacterium]
MAIITKKAAKAATKIYLKKKSNTISSRVQERNSKTARELKDRIPEELQKRDQWILWKAGTDKGRVSKIPCDVFGEPVDCNQPANQCSFEDVLSGYHRGAKSGTVSGIGFVFMGDGISGIDIDECIDDDGEISAEAKQIIESVDSYTEISPSGRGVHIIVEGTLPENVRGTNKHLGGKNGHYEAYSSGRYFTITGDLLEEQDSLNSRSSELEWFWNKYVKPTSAKGTAKSLKSKPKSAQDIVSIIENSEDAHRFKELMKGKKDMYKSPSEADFALLCLLAKYCGHDRELIKTVFDLSNLADRKKWRERTDYQERTIDRAIEQTAGDENHSKRVLEVKTAAEIIDEDLPDIQWVIPDLLPEGLTVLSGKPKKGKSFMALQIAIACATGGEVFGKRLQNRAALFLALEDGPVRLQTRLKKLCVERPENLYLSDASQFACLRDGNWEPLFEYLDQNKSVKFVVVDVLARIMPRQKRSVSQYSHEYDSTARLQAECIKRHICMLVVHHSRKAEAGDPFDSVSGTLGLTGAFDTLWVITPSPNDKATAILNVTGREVAEEKYAMKMSDGVWTMLGAYEKPVSVTREKILSLIRNEGALKPKMIAHKLRMKNENVRKTLLLMKREGTIQLNTVGRYILPKGENSQK